MRATGRHMQLARQNAGRWDPEAGAVLLFVVLMISILAVLVIQTTRAMQVEAAGARYFQQSLAAESLARSAVAVAMAVLQQDLRQGEVDHPGETWALLPQADALPVALPPGGEVEGVVADEAGKFPINFLVDDKGAFRAPYREVLLRLLQRPPLGLEPEEARALVAALKDWLDPDSEPEGIDGAEEDFYRSQERPHGCANRPMRSLEELLLVRHMRQDWYYGGAGRPGLKDLLTVYSEGKININTAPVELLRALVADNVSDDTASDWAESIVAYRREPLHWDFLGESDWYRNRVPGFNDIVVPQQLLTTKSSRFYVRMRGRVGVGRATVAAYLERYFDGHKTPAVRILHWQFS